MIKKGNIWSFYWYWWWSIHPFIFFYISYLRFWDLCARSFTLCAYLSHWWCTTQWLLGCFLSHIKSYKCLSTYHTWSHVLMHLFFCSWYQYSEPPWIFWTSPSFLLSYRGFITSVFPWVYQYAYMWYFGFWFRIMFSGWYTNHTTIHTIYHTWIILRLYKSQVH